MAVQEAPSDSLRAMAHHVREMEAPLGPTRPSNINIRDIDSLSFEEKAVYFA